MTSFLIIAGVLVFWFVLTTLVRFERGWVGLTNAQRRELRFRAILADLTASFERAFEQIGRALRPAIESTTAAMAEWAQRYEHEMRAEIRKMVETIRAGGTLTSRVGRDPDLDLTHDAGDLVRLHCAVVRWVNGLGPGDVPDEYALVERAMA